MSEPSTLCVIPARYRSSRFPGKPLTKISGKPMIQWIWENMNGAGYFSKVVVATESEKIQSAVERFGGTAIMTSSTHESGTERIIEVANLLPNFDYYLNVQGDEPALSADVPQLLLQAAFSHGDEQPMVFSACSPIKEEGNIHQIDRVKVVLAKNGRALYFSRAPIPFSKSGNWDVGMHFQHLGIYCFPSEVLSSLALLQASSLEAYEGLEQLRWLYHGIPIQMIEVDEPSSGVDRPEDIPIVEQLLRNRQ